MVGQGFGGTALCQSVNFLETPPYLSSTSHHYNHHGKVLLLERVSGRPRTSPPGSLLLSRLSSPSLTLWPLAQSVWTTGGSLTLDITVSLGPVHVVGSSCPECPSHTVSSSATVRLSVNVTFSEPFLNHTGWAILCFPVFPCSFTAYLRCQPFPFILKGTDLSKCLYYQEITKTPSKVPDTWVEYNKSTERFPKTTNDLILGNVFPNCFI